MKKRVIPVVLMWSILLFSIPSIAIPGIAVLILATSLYIITKYHFVSKDDFEKLGVTYENYLDSIDKLKSLRNKIEVSEVELHDYMNRKNKVKELLEKLEPKLSSKLEEYNESLLYPYRNHDDIPSSHALNNELSILRLEEKDIDEVDSLISDEDIDNKKNHRNQLKQVIRLFNVECNLIFSKLTVNNYESSHKKVVRAFETLNRLFELDNVRIKKELLRNKLKQMAVKHQYTISLEQEREIRKEERERIAEEQRAEQELNKKKKELEKEERHISQESSKLIQYLQKATSDVEKEIYANKIKDLEKKLAELQDSKKDIDYRLENSRAGYVYIISNIGSFGENIYKIGVTRRLEPMNRVKELSSASVPFEFDVHAMIFSNDAPKLETTLHRHFKDKEVNKINPRKEFFNVDLEEIKGVVLEHHNNTVNFNMEHEASQYRETIKLLDLESRTSTIPENAVS